MAESLELDDALRRFERLLFDTSVLVAEFTGRTAVVAAESLAWGIPIVTLNVRHFHPVTGLRYVAW